HAVLLGTEDSFYAWRIRGGRSARIVDAQAPENVLSITRRHCGVETNDRSVHRVLRSPRRSLLCRAIAAMLPPRFERPSGDPGEARSRAITVRPGRPDGQPERSSPPITKETLRSTRFYRRWSMAAKRPRERPEFSEPSNRQVLTNLSEAPKQ